MFWGIPPDAGEDEEIDELDEDSFQVDESIFDIQPAVSPPRPPATQPDASHDCTHSRSQADERLPSTSRLSTIPQSAALHRSNQPINPTRDETVEEPHPYDVAMAEFEAWFNSDAVVIVDKMMD
jgi:hypothetical protein